MIVSSINSSFAPSMLFGDLAEMVTSVAIIGDIVQSAGQLLTAKDVVAVGMTTIRSSQDASGHDTWHLPRIFGGAAVQSLIELLTDAHRQLFRCHC
jgi:hypothetical protein